MPSKKPLLESWDDLKLLTVTVNRLELLVPNFRGASPDDADLAAVQKRRELLRRLGP